MYVLTDLYRVCITLNNLPFILCDITLCKIEDLSIDEIECFPIVYKYSIYHLVCLEV